MQQQELYNIKVDNINFYIYKRKYRNVFINLNIKVDKAETYLFHCPLEIPLEI